MRCLIKISLIALVISVTACVTTPHMRSTHMQSLIIPHASIETFEHRGNRISALATRGVGSEQYEVWHASIAINSSTPPHHWHETDEVFIFLKGKGKAVVGDTETAFEAPCTVILPARVPHQIVNTGEEATDHFVIIGSGSKIFDKNNAEMQLPWRQ